MIEVVFVVLSTMVLVIIVAALWWLRRLDAPGQMPTRNEASTGAPVRSPPVLAWPTPETADVARRQFLNRSIVAALGFGLGGMGASSLAFLWPSASGGFGSKINLGKVADLRAAVEAGRGFHYVPEGRLWITEYPKSALATAKSSYGFFDQVESGLQEGLTVLYQKCTHLGCRVPECLSSQWFECPCHGSKYNRAGEKKAGPAPRGLDRFPTEISADGDVIVDTGAIILGPPIGVDTTGQEAAGPSCVGDANSE